MLKLGITGGIGSGKSTICQIFEVLGVPVYYADTRAKYLINKDATIKNEIISLLGEKAYDPEGNYNISYVSSTIFHNPDLLQKLNALVHPKVKIDSEKWFQNQKEAGHPYVLKEAAILFESGANVGLDYVIYVYAPQKLRQKRVMERNSISKREFYARKKNQWPELKKKKMADFVISNAEQKSIIEQVLKIHSRLLELAKLDV
jgi:dephospho-CoA kinase